MMTEWFLGEDTEGSLYSHSPGKTPRCLLQGVFPSDIINGQQCNFSLISWKTHDKRWLLRGVAKSKNLGRQVVMRRLLFCQNLGGRAPTLTTRFLHPCTELENCAMQCYKGEEKTPSYKTAKIQHLPEDFCDVTGLTSSTLWLKTWLVVSNANRLRQASKGSDRDTTLRANRFLSSA